MMMQMPWNKKGVKKSLPVVLYVTYVLKVVACFVYAKASSNGKPNLVKPTQS